MVYCAEVPTYHTLVTRRNGKVIIAGNCTANVGAGIVGYFENKAFGTHIDTSRLFLCKVSRNLEHQTGVTGAKFEMS